MKAWGFFNSRNCSLQYSHYSSLKFASVCTSLLFVMILIKTSLVHSFPSNVLKILLYLQLHTSAWFLQRFCQCCDCEAHGYEPITRRITWWSEQCGLEAGGGEMESLISLPSLHTLHKWLGATNAREIRVLIRIANASAAAKCSRQNTGMGKVSSSFKKVSLYEIREFLEDVFLQHTPDNVFFYFPSSLTYFATALGTFPPTPSLWNFAASQKYRNTFWWLVGSSRGWLV